MLQPEHAALTDSAKACLPRAVNTLACSTSISVTLLTDMPDLGPVFTMMKDTPGLSGSRVDCASLRETEPRPP